jgi:bifunctional UDP-N-acetylglucosamine pyrophosphorylase / glucosamine-1-phosphate N-acetyltransferase
VRVGDGAYVAAGSTITENVPSDGLGIARGRQVNKPGWAAKKRRELAAYEKPKKQSRRRSKAKTRRSAKTRKRK